jgi:dTDP-4-amino-4,6-dideoxygalactose transaminase
MTNQTSIRKAREPMAFLDLTAQFAKVRSGILDGVVSILDRQEFILGPEVEALENEVSVVTGSKYSIGCASNALSGTAGVGAQASEERCTE